jgi:hypothetical protein
MALGNEEVYDYNQYDKMRFEIKNYSSVTDKFLQNITDELSKWYYASSKVNYFLSLNWTLICEFVIFGKRLQDDTYDVHISCSNE